MKPLIAAAVLAAMAGGVAAGVYFAVPRGEEEVLRQAEQPTTTASAEATTAPQGTLWRWGNVTVVVPDGSPVIVGGTTIPDFIRPEGGRMITLDIISEETGRAQSTLAIDAENGDVLVDQVLEGDRPAIDQVFQTLTVAPLDPATAPWPYNGEPPPDLPREHMGKITFVRPDPSAGIVIGVGIAEGGIGAFIEIHNGRSFVFVQASTGAVTGADRILAEDQAMFQRYLASIVLCSADAAR